jgi:chromosome segregation ATPase
MSDLGGAILLSQQLSLYRVLDSFNQARDNNKLAANDVAWRNQYNDLVNRYNALLRDANRLADDQDRRLSNQNQHIKDLEATKTLLNNEIEGLRFRVVDLESQVAFLRAMDKELHPEAYQSMFRQS